MILRKLAFGVSIGILGSSNALLDGFGPGEIWPQFRGHTGTAIAQAQGIPVNLSRETLSWSVNLQGPGTSSPVIWGDRLFITSEVRAEGKPS